MMRMTRTTVLSLVGVASLLCLVGCSRSASDWNETDDNRQAELVADPWIGDEGRGDFLAPAPHWSRSEPGEGVWVRPSVERTADRGGEPWQEASEEFDLAVAAGWEPVFVRCAPGEVTVDLVRPLQDGSTATARIRAQDGEFVGWDVMVAAVDLHHSDGDWVPAPPTHAPAGFDLGACLEGEADAISWSGIPALLSSTGGPVPADD